MDLADLTRTRVQVETLTLRQAIQNGDVAWEAAVLAAHHTLERTPVADATGQFNEGWSAAHSAFHCFKVRPTIITRAPSAVRKSRPNAPKR